MAVSRETRPAWWTLDEIAARHRVSRRTVARWVDAGELRAVALPGAGRGIRQIRRVADAELRAFEAARPNRVA